MHKNTELYYKSALKLLMPVEKVAEIDGFKLTLGNNYYYFRGYEAPFNNRISCSIAANKYEANKLLAKYDIPVPKSTAIHQDNFTEDNLKQAIINLKFPLVIKPSWGSMGFGVICSVPNFECLYKEAEALINYHELLSIEEFHGGLQSYRVTIFKNKILAVSKRYPAQVIGDGKHTIKELVEIENNKRTKLKDYLKPIVFDSEVLYRLHELDLTTETIIPKNETIFLSHTTNAARGGRSENISEYICKENKLLFKNILKILNLKIAGIDLECKNLATPIINQGGVIIEINSNPSMRIHEDNAYGKPINITKKLMLSFIFKHPISYINYLLTKTKIGEYLTMSILLILFICIYYLI